MIVTIEEAQTKWCPMVRYTVAPDEDVSSNREGGLTVACIADKCMMWHEYITVADKGATRIERGYCGLAPP